VEAGGAGDRGQKNVRIEEGSREITADTAAFADANWVEMEARGIRGQAEEGGERKKGARAKARRGGGEEEGGRNP
jgi:hypothetical protein